MISEMMTAEMTRRMIRKSPSLDLDRLEGER